MIIKSVYMMDLNNGMLGVDGSNTQLRDLICPVITGSSFPLN